MSESQIHGHYFKDVSGLKKIDIYRLLELYEVTCPVAQHIIKKAMAAGKRGANDQTKDMREVADSANRWLDMRDEDAGRETFREAIDEIFGRLKERTEVPAVDPVVVANVEPSSADAERSAHSFDEARIDAIGQNGNDGEHYDAIAKAEDREFQRQADKVVPPAAGLRRADPIKPKNEALQLPDTSKLVDPSGKPSWDHAPNWAMFLTQSATGVWVFWRQKPYIVGKSWVRKTGEWQEFNSGDVVGRWQDSLERAPGYIETK